MKPKTYVGSVDCPKPGRPNPWRARFPVAAANGGKRTFDIRSFETEDEAIIWLQECTAARNHQTSHESVHASVYGQEVTLREMIPEHFAYLKGKVGEQTRANIRNNLHRIIEQFPDVVYCHHITFRVIEKLHERHWKTCCDHGRRPISQIKRFLRVIRKRGYRIDDRALLFGADEIGTPEPPKNRGAWGDETVAKIIAYLMKPSELDQLESPKGKGRCSAQSQARRRETLFYNRRVPFLRIFWLLIRYALRPKEVCLLNVGDWDSAHRILNIRKGTTKKKRARPLIIDETTAVMLDACAGGRLEHMPLFPRVYRQTPDGSGRWPREMLTRTMKQVLIRAGVEKGTLYWTRHTACSRLLREHADAAIVTAMSGHASIVNADPYFHVPDSRQRVIVDAYDADDRMHEDSLAARFKATLQGTPPALPDDRIPPDPVEDQGAVLIPDERMDYTSPGTPCPTTGDTRPSGGASSDPEEGMALA